MQWSFILVNYEVINGLLDGFESNLPIALEGLFIVFACCIVVPTPALMIRRCHDLGHSGWSILLQLIPIVGIFVSLYLVFGAGEAEANKYGPAIICQKLTNFDKRQVQKPSATLYI